MKFNQFSYDYSYENNVKASQKHPFHLVDPSPWPLVASIGGFTVTSGFAMYMHNYNGGLDTFFQGILITLFVMFTW
jgi:cytochrome c oxidase subunit 3